MIKNLFFLFPGYALYRGHSLLETAALNETPYSISDIFVWDKELAQVFLMLFIDVCWLSAALWLSDTGILVKALQRVTAGAKSTAGNYFSEKQKSIGDG